MATKKQIDANRKNAARSTGPGTLEGKAASSKNAMKTGLLSRDLIIRGESREEYDALLDELDDTYRPHGPVERFLVERIATAMWRMRRLVRVESAQVSVQLMKAVVHDPEILKGIAPLISEAELETLAFEDNLSSELAHGLLGAAIVEMATLVPKDQPHSWAGMEDEAPNVLKFFILLAGQLQRDPKKWFKELSERKGAFYALMVRVIRLRGVQDALQGQRKTLQIAQGLPYDPERMTRYQTALDNELYKAIKALQVQQDRRLATIEVVDYQSAGDMDVHPGENK